MLHAPICHIFDIKVHHLLDNIMMPLIHTAHSKPILRLPWMKPPLRHKNRLGYFSPDEYPYTFSESLSKWNGQKERWKRAIYIVIMLTFISMEGKLCPRILAYDMNATTRQNSHHFSLSQCPILPIRSFCQLYALLRNLWLRKIV